jgi:MFS family permease
MKTDSVRANLALLFLARILRMFSFGALAVVLVLYLTSRGLSTARVGILFSLTLIGDTVLSLWMTTSADRLGRRAMLIAGGLLMAATGLLFAVSGNFVVLLITAIIGVISPAAGEAGPFLSVEQACFSQIVPSSERTRVFAWYNLAGSFAVAAGSLACGTVVTVLGIAGWSTLHSYQSILAAYSSFGLLITVLFLLLSNGVETSPTSPKPGAFLGLHESRGIIFKLSALFALDAFAGGFVMQSLLAYWFYLRFHADPAVLGRIFFGANIFAGLSALAAARLAKRFGLVETMVFTHLPSNALLILLPFMPNLNWAIIVVLARFALSQMDVPTRQSYTMAMVTPEERSAAAGITGTARTIGTSISPLLAGPMLATASLVHLPLILAGSLKILYDLILYRRFKKIKPRRD